MDAARETPAKRRSTLTHRISTKFGLPKASSALMMTALYSVAVASALMLTKPFTPAPPSRRQVHHWVNPRDIEVVRSVIAEKERERRDLMDKFEAATTPSKEGFFRDRVEATEVDLEKLRDRETWLLRTDETRDLVRRMIGTAIERSEIMLRERG